MRIIFMGTPSFAVPSLLRLAGSHDVALAVTRPDAVRSRGRTLEPSPVKAAAVELGLAVHETTRMDAATLDELRDARADVFCVVAFGCILPDAVLRMAPLGCVNVHASLLPRWRGAAPVQRCILAGDECTGVSIMRIAHGVDTGDVCARASCPAVGKGADELTFELSELGAGLLARTLPSLASGEVSWTAQDDSASTLAPKIVRGELWLDPAASAEFNKRRVLASSSAAPARCVIAERTVRVTRAALERSHSVEAGALQIVGTRVLLGCTDGALEIIALKPDGRREMDAGSWAVGLRNRAVGWRRLS